MNLKDAFTLVEMLMVVAVVAILAAMAAPNFSQSYARLTADKTADDLLELCRWAQAMAIGQNRPYAMVFSGDRHSYQLMRAKADEGNEDGETADFTAFTGQAGAKHSVPDSVQLTSDQDKVEFYPDGTIDPATISVDAKNTRVVLSSTEVRGMMMKADSQ